MAGMISGDGYMIGAGEIVLDRKWMESTPDSELLAKLRLFQEVAGHPFWDVAHMANGFCSIEEFYEAAEREVIRTKSLKKKKQLTAIRRSEFDKLRPAVQLALIDRDGYVCSMTECYITDDLTVDHIIPISRGGTDDLSNLCFLCRSHNSSKGDRGAAT